MKKGFWEKVYILVKDVNTKRKFEIKAKNILVHLNYGRCISGFYLLEIKISYKIYIEVQLF